MEQRDIWNKRYDKNISLSDLTSEDIWIKKYDNYLVEKMDKTIIDLGCGSGINSYYLYDNGYNVIACDFSSSAIKIINKNNDKITTMCFDMLKGIPVYNQNIGVVLASLSTHYFTLNETEALYKNIYDLLEKSGYFIFRVNSKKEYMYNDKDGASEPVEENYYKCKDGVIKRYFDIPAILSLLKDFKVIDINESSFVYFGRQKYFIDGIVQKD